MKLNLFRSMLVLGSSLLLTTVLHAQESNKSVVEKLTADYDSKIQARVDLFNKIQQQKPVYDTVGLYAFRHDVKILKDQRRGTLINYVKANPKSAASVEALKDIVGYLPEDIKLYSKLYNGLDAKLKKSDDGMSLDQTITNFLKVSIGSTAPNFSALDTSRTKTISLEELRGKYILVDFWASWCAPCREENPHLLAVYQKYKTQNFEILGVALEQENALSAWKKAIQDDHLPWLQISDLKYWKSDIAKSYSIRSIPQNFLIDPKGKIVASNLRSKELEEVLQKIFK